MSTNKCVQNRVLLKAKASNLPKNKQRRYIVEMTEKFREPTFYLMLEPNQ